MQSVRSLTLIALFASLPMACDGSTKPDDGDPDPNPPPTDPNPAVEPSNIRLLNSSGTDFSNVFAGIEDYGEVLNGDSTEYREWSIAFRIARVVAQTPLGEFTIQPIDFVGETPLGAGNFTYELTFDDPITPTEMMMTVILD